MRSPQPVLPTSDLSLNHVLVATDFSPPARRAVERAAALAHEHRADLTLLHVAEHALPWPGRPAPPAPDLRLSQCRVQLARLARELKARFQVEAQPEIATGSINAAIARHAATADLLVLGARPWPAWHAPWGQPLGAARARQLLTRIDTPMLVVRLPVRWPWRKALVPVDLSGHSGQALRAAAAVAPGTQLHLFHALSLRQESEMRHACVTEAVIRGYRERHRARARQQLHALIAQLQLDTGRVVPVLAQGEARHLTLRKAAQVGAELIVLAKQEPSWWVDLVFGSLTRQLLREAPCDLLVVPPQRT